MTDALQTHRIDIFLKGVPDFVDEPWLFRTPALGMEKTRLFHQVNRKSDGAFFDLMDNFNVGVLLISIYLAALLAALLAGLCIRRLAYQVRFGTSRKPKLFRYFADRKLGFKKTHLPALSVFALCVGEFFWLTQIFLTNTIKTNKVVLMFLIIWTIYLIQSLPNLNRPI